MTSPNTIIADLTAEVETLRKQRDEWKAIAEFSYAERSKLERHSDEIVKLAEVIEMNAEECLDFDECTAILVHIDDYNNLIEAIENAKGGS